MKHLNRKEYKETIKRFRESCPLARLQNHWVYFRDEDRMPTLMYVNYSRVERLRKKDPWYRKYHCFEFEGYQFYLKLYGSPTLRENWRGLDNMVYVPLCSVVNKDCEYKILNDDEVVKYYNGLLDEFKYNNRQYFSTYKKNL